MASAWAATPAAAGTEKQSGMSASGRDDGKQKKWRVDTADDTSDDVQMILQRGQQNCRSGRTGVICFWDEPLLVLLALIWYVQWYWYSQMTSELDSGTLLLVGTWPVSWCWSQFSG